MNKLFMFFISITLFSSCIELVQDEFDDFNEYTTLNAVIIADSVINVHVSQTNELNSSVLPFIENATVTITVNQTEQYRLNYTDSGTYTSSAIANAGDTIFCEVITENNDTTTAQCIIPVKTPIASLEFYLQGWVDDEGYPQPSFLLTIPNQKPDTLYYEVYISSIQYDELNDKESACVFNNIEETGSTIVKNIDFQVSSYPVKGYSFVLELRSISESYYQYYQSLVLYNEGREPDISTGSYIPYNLYSNVENGYGIFTGYSLTLSDTLQ